jgi:hypothetical protein
MHRHYSAWCIQSYGFYFQPTSSAHRLTCCRLWPTVDTLEVTQPSRTSTGDAKCKSCFPRRAGFNYGIMCIAAYFVDRFERWPERRVGAGKWDDIDDCSLAENRDLL